MEVAVTGETACRPVQFVTTLTLELNTGAVTRNKQVVKFIVLAKVFTTKAMF